jgi:hypothetical protein
MNRGIKDIIENNFVYFDDIMCINEATNYRNIEQRNRRSIVFNVHLYSTLCIIHIITVRAQKYYNINL